MKAKDALGRLGENLAAIHLEAAGYRIVARNWRCPRGEIDIVARDGPVLVVVEVKTRTTDAYGHPFEAISPAKLKRLHLLAAAWAAAHPGDGGLRFRVDVVGILCPDEGLPTLEHLREVH